MGLTRLQLATRLRSRLSATGDDVLHQNADLYQDINDGLQALSEERDWPWLEAMTTLSLVASDDTYTLPAGLTRIHGLFIDGQELDHVQYRELQRFTQGSPGTPRRYSVVGNELKIASKPSAAMTLDVYYQVEEGFLDDDADVTALPNRYASLAITFAAIYSAVRTRDQALLTALIALKKDELTRAYDALNRSTLSSRIVTRDDNHA